MIDKETSLEFVNGTCTFHFKVCRVCGKEAEDDGDYDDYEPDYRHE